MKEILIPLNFTTTPTVYDTKQSFSTSDEASGVLTFTTTADVTGTVASLTIHNASENANRQTVLIERLNVNRSPFSYAFKNPLPFGQYEGTVLLKKNMTVIASASFLFAVNSSLSAEVLPDLVKAFSLDELVENVETEVSNLKDAFHLTVSETVKGVNKTESSLQAQENVRYLNEHQRKANELERIANENARLAAELERKDTFDTLVDSEVIEQTVAQEVAEKYQEIEALNAPEMVSFRQQLVDNESEIRTTQSNPTNFSGAIVTIIDDDARPDFRTVWKPYLDANPDIKIGIAVVKDWTLDGSALSLSELYALQDAGHDLLCHTTHHVASYEITPEAAELDYPEAVQWMKANGLKGYEHLVYPGGLSPSFVNIKNVARKHFKYAISTEAAGNYAVTPVDNWCVPRMNGDSATLSELQAAVDYAKSNNVWLILMTHSHVLLSEGSQKMSDFITYVKSQNVPIMPYSEAVKLKGNAVALGEHTSQDSTFISIDGDSKGVPHQSSGLWTPTLAGTVTPGAHTYSVQSGNWIKIGNLITATFDISIPYANLDAAMAGNLTITGLPIQSITIARTILEYNILSLGAGYSGVIGAMNIPSDIITILKMGNNVNTAFVDASALPVGQTVIFRGQVTYQVHKPLP